MSAQSEPAHGPALQAPDGDNSSTSPIAAWSWVVRLVIVAGLAVDAGIHFYLAPTQPPADPSGGLSQISLFYAEGAVSVLAALLVLVKGVRLTYAFAFLVAVSALGAVVLYRYVNVGSLGPLPNMYEPSWYLSKTATAVAEGVAALAAAWAVLLHGRVRSRPKHPDTTTD